VKPRYNISIIVRACNRVASKQGHW